MNKMIRVAEGIIDAKEFWSTNLEDWSSVDDYARNGLCIDLNVSQCEAILEVCKSIVERLKSGEIICDMSWHIRTMISIKNWKFD